jgi:hypothetical protein
MPVANFLDHIQAVVAERRGQIQEMRH